MDWNTAIMSIIPNLTFTSHKGQSGRIGVVGGSKNYTGAPYFAAISALKVGCDLAHVFCTSDAAQVIKSYSPELIVHPTLDNEEFIEGFTNQLPFLHSLVLGPGLGRDKTTFQCIRSLLPAAIYKSIPLVFDADALFYLNEGYGDVHSYNKAILTPNQVEFARLYSSVIGTEIKELASSCQVKELAEKLGNITIVRKGPVDIISDGKTIAHCQEPGSPKRCGGQGDLLSGALGVFSYWAQKSAGKAIVGNAESHSLTVIAAMAACLLTRRCGHLAFQKCKRSTLTTDMIGEINEAFSSLFIE